MAGYDLVLLDADETLLDFTRSEHEALGRTLERYHLPPRAGESYLEVNRQLWAAFDRGEISQQALARERFAVLCRQYGLDEDPVEMNTFYLTCIGSAPYFLPGAEAFCRTLAAGGRRMALITNGMVIAQRGRYVGSGLNKLIPHIFISQEVGWHKPQKEYFDAVLAALAPPPGTRTVVMGDSLTSDILGANRGGLDSIWYNPKGAPLREGALPTYTVADYAQAARLILED